MLVHTTKGPVEHDRLTVNDIVTLENGSRVTATEWHLGDELVRRDVHVNMLMSMALGTEQGDFHG